MAKATIEHTMTDEQFEDVCTAASYGGIDYWVRGCKFQPRQENRQPVFKLIDEDGDKYTLTREQIEQAMLDLWTGKISIRSDIQNSIRWAIFEKEYGEIDANAADCIIQAAAFQEIVYG